ncbi:MAG: EAL domain-containing protein [Coriobacteriales bacterium]
MDRDGPTMSDLPLRLGQDMLRNMSAARQELAPGEAAGTARTSFYVLYFGVVDVERLYFTFEGKVRERAMASVGEVLTDRFGSGRVCRADRDGFVALVGADVADEAISGSYARVAAVLPDGAVVCRVGAFVWSDAEVSPLTAADRARLASRLISNRADHHVATYDPAMEARRDLDDYVRENFDRALEQGWIRPHFQPIVRLLTGEVCAAEALARWEDPKLGVLEASDFVLTLKRSGMVARLDRHILRESCRAFAENVAAGGIAIPFSVNLSRYDFDSGDPVRLLEDALEEFAVPRDMVFVEMSEKGVAAGGRGVVDGMRRLREDGIGIWIDDFGGGYSTLGVLKDEGVGVIKLDWSLQYDVSEHGESVVSSLTDMGKRLGKMCLAEGVETESQARYLRDIGCELAQGYYFGMPEPFDAFMRHARERGIERPDIEWRRYLNRGSALDFPLDRAFAIFEYTVSELHFVYANRRFDRVLEALGIPTLGDLEARANVSDLPDSGSLRASIERAITAGTVASFCLLLGDRYARISLERVAVHRGRYLMRLFAQDVSTDDASSDGDESAVAAMSHIVQLFDCVLTVNLTKNVARVISLNAGYEWVFRSMGGIDSLRRQAVLESIHPGDRKRYLAFTDVGTIIARIGASRRSILCDCFRMRGEDGTYAWKTHMALYVPQGHDDVLLYCIRDFDLDLVDRVRVLTRSDAYSLLSGGDEVLEIASDLGRETSSERLTKARLWDDLMAGVPLPVFFSDVRGRLLAASKGFLEYFGLDTGSDALGLDFGQLGIVDDFPAVLADQGTFLLGGGGSAVRVVSCHVKGRHCRLRIGWSPVRSGGTVHGVLGVVLGEELDGTEPLPSDAPSVPAPSGDLPTVAGSEPRRGCPATADGGDSANTEAGAASTDASALRVLHDLPMGVMVLDMDRRIALWNSHAEQVTGYPASEMVGRRCDETGLSMLDEQGRSMCGLTCPFFSILDAAPSQKRRVFAHNKAGYSVLVEIRPMALRDADGKVGGVALIFDKMTSREYSDDALLSLTRAAASDPLTGLSRRERIESVIRFRLDEFARAGRRFAVLFADINNFGDFNNTFGHEAGDLILRRFGDAVMRASRRTDACGRWGGDEFVMVFELGGERDELSVAERLAGVTNGITVTYNGLDLHIHLSMGITMVREGDDVESIVRRADDYMYRAKRHGGNLIVTDENAGQYR